MGLVSLYRATLSVLLLLSLEAKGLDHGGSDLYVTFLPFAAPLYQELKLYITTPESVPVNFTISAPGTGYFHRATVDPGGVKEFIFNDDSYILRSTTDRAKGIIITAENDKQVFVYTVQDISRATDSLLVLPPHHLGTASYTYMAAMFHTLDGARFSYNHNGDSDDSDDEDNPVDDIHSLVGIVSTENDTLLTITPSRDVNIGTESVQAGRSVLVTLHRAETLLIAFVGDLTGTKVTSNRPISFFCGDQCTNVPSGVGACDQILEQLPPVEGWGRQFATAPLKTRSFDVFRIVASASSTIVSIRCTQRSGTEGYVDAFILNEGGFANVQVSSTDFCWMEADKSILILQFAVGTEVDSMPGDPFMALVPAVSHYTNSLTLPMVHSSLNDFTHYLNIIIPAEHYQPDQIFLDGQSLQSLALEFVPIVYNGETMAYATQVAVSAITHTVTHGNSTGLVGVTAYGFAYHASYGHVGGMRFPQFNNTIDTGNTTDTTNNTTDTADNSTDMADNATGTACNTTNTADNTTNMADNTTSTADNTTNTADNTTNMADNATDTADNTTDTADNTTNTADNTTNTADNTTNMADNATDTADNTIISADNTTSTATCAATEPINSAVIMIVLWCLLGLLMLFAAAVLGACILLCICLCVRISHKKQDINIDTTYDTVYVPHPTQGENFEVYVNPAYEGQNGNSEKCTVATYEYI